MDHAHHFLFDQSGFMPHGHCYLWQPGLIFTHVASDFLIGLAYLAISILLYILVRRIRLPFGPIFIAFGVFIAACGVTHFMSIWTLWYPDYWLSGMVKVVTAAASLATGLALHKISPKVMEFAHSARLSEERKIKLESAHAELELLYEKVKESDLMKTQFFSNVSHELRTPLALILGPVEDVLSSSPLSDNQRQKLEVVRRNSKTLLKQVNDLLDISKLEAGRMKIQYAKADLVKLFRYVAAHFETAMQTRNIFFSLHAPDSILVDVDPEKIQRVFMNLLSNAIKFTPDGGRIRISIKTESSNALFTIEDTGPGVPHDMRSMIFERFSQADGGTTRKIGGTGLGLAIVKDFVELHKGWVKLLNGHSHGATFVVSLPLRAPEGVVVLESPEAVGHIEDVMLEGSAEEIRSKSHESSMESFESNRPTVLVCEDNPDMNSFISETLATDFNVLRAIDGKEGIEKARNHQPDLIVSDIMMPYMSGDQLVRELKKEDLLKNTPILLLSARADEEMRLRLLKEGVSDYIVKPFAGEELRARAVNLVTLKTTRDVLEKELSKKSLNMTELAKELGHRKREAELAFEVAKVAREEAEKASEVKGAFLSLVSHELNTPLMAMNLTVQLMQQSSKEVDSFQQEMLDRLSSSSKQLKSLVEGLLEYVKSGRTEANHFSKVNLIDVVNSTLGEFQSMASKKNLDLKVDVDPSLTAVKTDPTKFKVILNNLLVNALKFTEKGYVTVTLRSVKDGVVQLEVKDSGPGISQQDQERIFEPFERVEPLERKSIPGMGLGLALVKQLSFVLGAEVWMESTAGQGSTFFVQFPNQS